MTMTSVDHTATTVPRHHPERWRMSRAGISNVWHYYDNEFDFSGGRMILRGANGSGKSRAMEMLLPFLLDGDRRRMDSTGSANVRMEVLMKAGGEGQTNRVGYLWLELERDGTEEQEHLTLGAHVKYSTSTHEAKVWYFITPLRVGHDLVLIDQQRQPLRREELASRIGPDNLTDVARLHRERVRNGVFGLTGVSGDERYSGLLQLLHTLRSPDVGNQIDEGNLPRLLSEALPPLSEQALVDAGSRLDALSEARASQQRLESSLERVSAFLATYERYAAGVLSATISSVEAAAVNAADSAATAETRASERDTLAEQARAAIISRDRLDEDVTSLSNVIIALRQSPAYLAGLDLENLRRGVSALEKAASGRLDSARESRREEGEAVTRLDQAATELKTIATELSGALGAAGAQLRAALVPTTSFPTVVSVELVDPQPQEDPVRVGLHDVLTMIPRPAPRLLAIEPEDMSSVARALANAIESATGRADLANARRSVASSLLEEEKAATTAQREADLAAENAERSAGDADDSETRRDAVARTYADEWRGWTALAETADLLGDVEWHGTILHPLLVDLDSLAGLGPFDVDLTDLDQIAVHSSEPARLRSASDRAALDAQAAADEARREELESDRNKWLSAQDPEPPVAPWETPLPPQAVPFWQCVDFTEGLGDDERGGLEGALLAAGILTAGVTQDGSFVPLDGQRLLIDVAQPAEASISSLLSVDPDSPVSADLVSALLQRIGRGPAGNRTWVAEDGSWGNGPLHGQNRAATAEHIGASARAAWRARRIEEIDQELAGLDRARLIRDEQYESLRARDEALSAHVRSAPQSRDLATARSLATAAQGRAAEDRSTALAKEGRAHELFAAWSKANADHRLACDHNDLPHTIEGLSDAREQATSSVTVCRDAQAQTRRLIAQLAAHEKLAQALPTHRGRRESAERSAKQAWAEWSEGHEELDTLEQTIGLESFEINQQLHDRETELTSAKDALQEARDNSEQIGKDAAVAVNVAAAAVAEAIGSASHLRSSVSELNTGLTLPGLASAVFRDHADEIEKRCRDLADGSVAPESVRGLLREMRSAMQSGPAIEETALIRAENALIRDLGASYEVIVSVASNVHLVELADAEARLPIAAAHSRIEEKALQAKDAVSERERTVFTEYVIGGVGEELRRRTRQSSELVAAMNTSLGSISTSHGIKVKLHWRAAEDAGTPIARILELTATSADLRPPHETAELVELLRARVEEAYAIDPTVGYATHLKHALDYRKWHRIEMALTRPELGHGKDVPVTRRTPLSQGERRFVSYVILFAAVDAHLSGLPDADRALRLIVLDDAFAKVDTPTIAELMGLLVRLDIDFCMTGHGLWGTFPEVPSLDVYEIRRESDGPAVTTHVHWDGHTRHMRIA